MSKNRPSHIPESQWIEDLPSYILEGARLYLPLEHFGFRETFRDENRVLLKSEWCKIRFYVNWGTDNQWTGAYEAKIFYGRFHAPDQHTEMDWNGERCNCWHQPSLSYSFDFIAHFFSDYQRPMRRDIFNEYLSKKADFPSRIHWRFAIEAEVWKYYAPHIFYLFDLRQPELWEQYRSWLKARYFAEGRKEEDDVRKGIIPYYRVC
jgi:hypothetical protein